jgi:hypothetical protein
MPEKEFDKKINLVIMELNTPPMGEGCRKKVE